MNVRILVLAAAVVITSCDKSEPSPPPVVALTVSSIEPTSGPYYTVVTISGTGFDPTTAGNEVTVNGKVAEVISATATELQINVPARAGKGEVAVTTNAETATGPVFNFEYTVDVTTIGGQAGVSGNINGDATVSRFNLPSEIKIDPNGNIYVSDRGNHAIKRVTPGGVTSVYAGFSGSMGATDGDITIATFNGPNGIAFDNAGSMYLADLGNSKIRKITSGITAASVVSVFSGTGVLGFVNGLSTVSQYNVPEDCAVDAAQNVYVSEFGNHTIRKLNSSGESTTLAGDGTPGFVNGTGTAAKFNNPIGIAFNLTGDLIVADYGNHVIRKVTVAGVVTTIAGGSTSGFVDGPTSSALFFRPRDIAIDDEGNIYICDSANNAIRLLTHNGNVVTLAGDGTAGTTNGSGASARFTVPLGIDVDETGNVYVVEQNHQVRKLSVN